MLLEGKYLMGQAHAALGAVRRTKAWRRSLVFEVTLVPPRSGKEYRADCAVKATPAYEDGKDVLQIWLWGFGAQQPGEQRPKAKSAGGSTALSRSAEEDRCSSRVRSSVGGDAQRKQRERKAIASVQKKLPDLEDMVVLCGRTWRAAESSSRHNEGGEAAFRQAVSRLDTARLCLGMPPLLPRLRFERKRIVTEVYDTKDLARSVPLDLLSGQGLQSWLWKVSDEADRMPMKGVALVAQQATHIFTLTADACTPQSTCDVGEVVVAVGPPQEASGVVLVPIETEGVVQVGHFAIDLSTISLAHVGDHKLVAEERTVVAPPTPQLRPVAGVADPDGARSSDSSTDQEDDQLQFRLGLMA